MSEGRALGVMLLLLMQDDVVSSVSEDQQRFEEANERTLRWLDRCIQVRHAAGQGRGGVGLGDDDDDG